MTNVSSKKSGRDILIGVDEAGRGPLAGPVVAAAVYLKTFRFSCRIDDSKKLTRKERDEAFLELGLKSVFGVGIINEAVIDRVNILAATQLAMERAIRDLMAKMGDVPARRVQLLVDGTVRLNVKMPVEHIIEGDGKSKSIASASIVAKTVRDRIMEVYDTVFPLYGFRKHKGYPTEAHRRALAKHGSSRIHRKTFAGV
ncbi:MAG: ribonuclease HII [Candidatus Omnitrophica bacterium]|nr:ribonuclease HII [Candidatus Omnitrophota bacterium]